MQYIHWDSIVTGLVSAAILYGVRTLTKLLTDYSTSSQAWRKRMETKMAESARRQNEDRIATEEKRRAEAEWRDDVTKRLDDMEAKLNRSVSQQVVNMFSEWVTDKAYAVGDRVKYDGKLYKCAQAHTSQSDWTPDVTPALWTPLAAEDADDDLTTVPVWVQPPGAEDAYNTGDRVLYPDAEGTVYESVIDGNVWSPADYPQGWTVVS